MAIKKEECAVLVAQRKELLLQRLASDGRLVAKDIAAELDVSEDSIRRDLRELAEAGLCQRVYGGALPISPAVADYPTRQSVAVDSKAHVAGTAAGLIKPGTAVILDGGTTALAVVRALPKNLSATVITHSPTVATALGDHRDIEVFLLGGRIFKHSMVACGSAAVEAAQNITADLFLLGVTGVHHLAGLTTGDADEAAMKRALSRRAAETYVMASAEKLGAASRFTVIPLRDATGVITDAPASDRAVRDLVAAGVAVVTTER